jgi:hypothetical protein
MFDAYRDYFTREQLMAAIAKAPYIPGRLSEYFESIPLTSTVLALEDQPTNGASILAGVPRGTPSKIETLEKRSVHTFVTNHYRADGKVYADEVLNARAYGANAAAEIIHGVAHPDANIIFGTVIDDEMGDEVKVTVVAAGFDRLDPAPPASRATGSSRLSELFADDEPAATDDEDDDGFDVPSFLK